MGLLSCPDTARDALGWQEKSEAATNHGDEVLHFSGSGKVILTEGGLTAEGLALTEYGLYLLTGEGEVVKREEVTTVIDIKTSEEGQLLHLETSEGYDIVYYSTTGGPALFVEVFTDEVLPLSPEVVDNLSDLDLSPDVLDFLNLTCESAKEEECPVAALERQRKARLQAERVADEEAQQATLEARNLVKQKMEADKQQAAEAHTAAMRRLSFKRRSVESIRMHLTSQEPPWWEGTWPPTDLFALPEEIVSTIASNLEAHLQWEAARGSHEELEEAATDETHSNGGGCRVEGILESDDEESEEEIRLALEAQERLAEEARREEEEQEAILAEMRKAETRLAEATRRTEEEALQRKAEEEASRAKEEAARKAEKEEEEARMAEEAAKRKTEEEELRKAEEVEKRRAEEEETRKAEEAAKQEEEARKTREEEQRRAEEQIRKAEEEEKTRVAEEEAAQRKTEEEELRKADEVEKRRAEEEETRKAEEAAKQEEEARKTRELVIQVKRREQEQRRAEEQIRKAEEEEAAEKLRKSEEEEEIQRREQASKAEEEARLAKRVELEELERLQREAHRAEETRLAEAAKAEKKAEEARQEEMNAEALRAEQLEEAQMDQEKKQREREKEEAMMRLLQEEEDKKEKEERQQQAEQVAAREIAVMKERERCESVARESEMATPTKDLEDLLRTSDVTSPNYIDVQLQETLAVIECDEVSSLLFLFPTHSQVVKRATVVASWERSIPILGLTGEAPSPRSSHGSDNLQRRLLTKRQTACSREDWEEVRRLDLVMQAIKGCVDTELPSPSSSRSGHFMLQGAQGWLDYREQETLVTSADVKESARAWLRVLQAHEKQLPEPSGEGGRSFRETSPPSASDDTKRRLARYKSRKAKMSLNPREG